MMNEVIVFTGYLISEKINKINNFNGRTQQTSWSGLASNHRCRQEYVSHLSSHPRCAERDAWRPPTTSWCWLLPPPTRRSWRLPAWWKYRSAGRAWLWWIKGFLQKAPHRECCWPDCLEKSPQPTTTCVPWKTDSNIMLSMPKFDGLMLNCAP